MKKFFEHEQEFKKYFELFEKWNSKINLMSVSNYKEFVDKHVLDALECLTAMEGVNSLLDLGTGGGFPGIPLKIVRKDLEVVVLDATRKKISFCEEVIRELGLKNIDAVWGRAEDEGIIKGLGAFDAVISRATWELKDFLKIGHLYSGVGGKIVAMKGANWKEEVVAAEKIIREIPLEPITAHEYQLKTGEKRAIVSFRRAE